MFELGQRAYLVLDLDDVSSDKLCGLPQPGQHAFEGVHMVAAVGLHQRDDLEARALGLMPDMVRRQHASLWIEHQLGRDLPAQRMGRGGGTEQLRSWD
jgi:hypothetical protein